MIHRMGRMKRMLAVGMLAAILLSGCSCGTGNSSASSEPSVEDATEKETEAQQLEKQVIAILNLSPDKDVGTDDSLDQAADFFLAYVLQNPQAYVACEQPINLDGMLDKKDTLAFVYDGQLPAVQAGAAVLTALAKVDSDMGMDLELMYHTLKSISIVHGEGEKGSVWLILAQYLDTASGSITDEAPSEDGSEKLE